MRLMLGGAFQPGTSVKNKKVETLFSNKSFPTQQNKARILQNNFIFPDGGLQYFKNRIPL